MTVFPFSGIESHSGQSRDSLLVSYIPSDTPLMTQTAHSQTPPSSPSRSAVPIRNSGGYEREGVVQSERCEPDDRAEEGVGGGLQGRCWVEQGGCGEGGQGVFGVDGVDFGVGVG